jgi:prepilin-type N-terminal cleavage/methylation domain-containing protein
MTGKNRKLGGFTLVEMLIVAVIVLLLVAVAIPNYVGTRPLDAPINSCINNLRIIDGAKGQWVNELHKQITDTPSVSDIQPYMGFGSASILPVCPNDPKHSFATSYSPNNAGTKPVCRIMPTNHVLP